MPDQVASDQIKLSQVEERRKETKKEDAWDGIGGRRENYCDKEWRLKVLESVVVDG